MKRGEVWTLQDKKILGECIGRLSDDDMKAVSKQLIEILGL